MSDMAIEKVKRLLREVPGVIVESDGSLRYDLYVDDATLSSRTLKAIVESEGFAEETFYNELSDYHTDVSDWATDYLVDKIGYSVDEAEEDGIDLWDTVRELVDFYFPYEDFLKQRLLVNVVVDSGDKNYDYSINKLYEMDFEDPEIRESGLVWLAAKQGYSLEDVRLAVQENTASSKFLKTLDNELTHTNTGLNAVTFLLDMTLGEVIDVLALGKKIHVLPGVRVGLVDFWHGSRGLIGIELESGFTIEEVEFDLEIDASKGYGVGVTSNTWSSQYQIV